MVLGLFSMYELVFYNVFNISRTLHFLLQAEEYLKIIIEN